METNELPRNWYNLNVTVTVIELIDLNLIGIESGAFDVKAFTNLKRLLITNMKMPILNHQTFRGLGNLETLQLKNVELEQFNGNVLESLTRLKSVVIDDCGDKELTIDNLFGQSKLNIQRLAIKNCNLGDRITAKTFSSLHNILSLNLQMNQISRLDENSFSEVMKSVKIIDLKNNHLKTLDKNLFRTQRPINDHINVFLDLNQWQCDCELDAFRQFVQSNGNIKFDKIHCKTPKDLIINDFSDMFCDASKNLTNEKSPSNVEEVKSLPLQCEQSKTNVTIRRQDVRPVQMKNNELFIDPKQYPNNSVLIGFKQLSPDVNGNKSHKSISTCLMTLNKYDNYRTFDPIRLESHLKSNQLYRFCLVDRSFVTFPLDCYSIYRKDDFRSIESDAWIMMKHKSIALGICIVSPIASLFAGMLLSLIFAKCFPMIIRRIEPTDNVYETPNASELEAIKRLKFVTIHFLYFFFCQF